MLSKEDALRKTYLEGLIALKKQNIIEAYRACEDAYMEFLEKDKTSKWHVSLKNLQMQIKDYTELYYDLRELLIEEDDEVTSI